VAASLPGGDPLAAVLAAGETPSPEMVAAAGDSVAISPSVGGACLAGIVALLFVACLLADRVRLINRAPLQRSADSLKDEAKEVIAHLGFEEPIGDSASGFFIEEPDLEMVETTKLPVGVTDRWELLKTGPWPGWRFWYRQSPDEMIVNEFWNGFAGFSHTRITNDSPSWTVPGMAGVWLSPQGELRRLRVIPDWTSTEDPAQTRMDIEKWCECFPESMIGFDLSDLSPTRISSVDWIPPDAYDQFQSWEGTWPGGTEALYVMAAAYRGRPVYFKVHHTRKPTYAGTHAAEARFGLDLLFYIIIGVQFGAVALAWRNLRLGRGDRRGAFRLAFLVFVANMLIWVLAASHVKGQHENGILHVGVAQGLWQAGFLWLLYIALEPFARRFWPETLISWTRVLDGRWRDPRVGRDLLVGVFVGTMGTVVFQGSVFTSALFGLPTGLEGSPPRSLLGAMDLIAEALRLPFLGIALSLTILIVLVLLRVMLRHERWAAIVALCLFAAVFSLGNPGHMYVAWLPAGMYIGAVILLLTRFGLFAVVTTFVTTDLLKFPITTDSSAFYFGNGLFAIVLVLALAAYGVYTSVGSRVVIGAGGLRT
jgi:serine/threonine-protein kinase